MGCQIIVTAYYFEDIQQGKAKPRFTAIGLPNKKTLMSLQSRIYSNKNGKHFIVVFKDCICDMVAEVPSLNIVQFVGCLNCYTKDVHENHRHQYPCHEPIVCRSPEDVCEDASLAEKEKTVMEYLEGSLTKEDISVVEDRIKNIDCPRSFNSK